MIWKNGGILPDSAATVSVYDSGWMYGDSTFETTRSFNTRPFKLEEHFDRLIQSAELAMLQHSFSKEEMISGYGELLEANSWTKHEEHRGMIHLSRGLLPIYGNSEPWLMMTVTPLRQVSKGVYAKYQNGVAAAVSRTEQVEWRTIKPSIKHRSRLFMKIAEAEVKEAWPLLCRVWGQERLVCESSGANVFIHHDQDGMLWTPGEQCCLMGISRAFVMSLIDVEERYCGLYPEMIDEMFFTATPFCIMPVTKLNGQPIGDGRPGPITREIMQKWIDAVDCDFVEQARNW